LAEREGFEPSKDAVKASDRALRLEIGEEGKMKFALAAKGGMTPRAINRNAKEFSAKASKLGKQFVVERHLIAADWTPVCRIKGEHDWPPAKLRQTDELVGGAAQGEFRGGDASP